MRQFGASPMPGADLPSQRCHLGHFPHFRAGLTQIKTMVPEDANQGSQLVERVAPRRIAALVTFGGRDRRRRVGRDPKLVLRLVMSNGEDQLQPGRPGRGYDPTSGFTDGQWYFYHLRGIAYFGAFSTEAYDGPALVETARSLIAAAPQYNEGYRGAGSAPSDAALLRIATVETVASFDGFPDRWLDDGSRVMDDADLPMFRIRVAQLADGPDALGRRSFLLVQVAHALTEGSDSARLSRSRSAAHADAPRQAPVLPARIALPARLAGGLMGLAHLVASRLWAPHPRTVRLASRAYPRHLLTRLARDAGVSQRALFMALATHTIANAGTPAARAKISCAYTSLAPGGGEHRDRFMRMRMLYTSFRNRHDLRTFARTVEQTVQELEGRASGFQDEMHAASLSFHRGLARLAPFLYSPKFFAFWPYDVVFSLLTPHQIAGSLSKGLMEPVYCGTSIPGITGCIVVPGREWVTFNFFLGEHLLPHVERLDAAVRDLSDGLAPEAEDPAEAERAVAASPPPLDQANAVPGQGQ